MYYAKFKNISNKPVIVRETRGDIVIQPGTVFFGDVEALLGDSQLRRIHEILPKGNYRFETWDREDVIKTLHRMGVDFNQYSMTTSRLADLVRAEYNRQQTHMGSGGQQTTPVENPTMLPMDRTQHIIQETQKKVEETKKVFEIYHNDSKIEVIPADNSAKRTTEKQEKTIFQKETEQFVENHLEDIKDRRKVEQAKKFDQRKLNVDIMIIFLSKHVDDWQEYDFIDNKWPAFERVKKLKKEGSVEDVDGLLQVEMDDYKERLKTAPKKWTGATKDKLLKLIKKLGQEVTAEHKDMEKKKLMVCVKDMFELYKRCGLSIDTRKYYYEYSKDGKPIKK